MNQNPKCEPGRKRRWWFVFIALAVVVPYLLWSGKPDPDFEFAKLRGLTPEQVIQRLGPPDVDPRLPKWGSWKPENKEGQRLTLYYKGGRGGRFDWQGFSYGIVFEDNRVVDVKVGSH